MRYSLIIPAYNEARLLPATLRNVAAAMAECALPGELVVVDNNSTDATAEVAAAHGAKVVFEGHNQIARARNAGAAVATGDALIFLDADTHLPPALLAAALRRLASGTVAGGGATIQFDQPQSALAEWCLRRWTGMSRTFGWAAGSFVYVRRDAFEAIGGFPEAVYAGEEILFSRGLRRWARQNGCRVEIIPEPPVVTSARKFEWHPPWKIALTHAVLAACPLLVRSRRFCRFWYTRPAASAD